MPQHLNPNLTKKKCENLTLIKGKIKKMNIWLIHDYNVGHYILISKQHFILSCITVKDTGMNFPMIYCLK